MNLWTGLVLVADFDKEAAIPTGAGARWKHADWSDWTQPQDWAASHSFIAWTASAENGNGISATSYCFLALLHTLYLRDNKFATLVNLNLSEHVVLLFYYICSVGKGIAFLLIW